MFGYMVTGLYFIETPLVVFAVGLVVHLALKFVRTWTAALAVSLLVVGVALVVTRGLFV